MVTIMNGSIDEIMKYTLAMFGTYLTWLSHVTHLSYVWNLLDIVTIVRWSYQ